MPNKTPLSRLYRVLALIQDAYAPNTIRAYRADMEEFIRFCNVENTQALPAAPATVAGFILSTAEMGMTSATIRRKVASISAIHRYSEYADPTKHAAVRLAVRKVNRKLGTRFKQAYPITKRLLEQMLSCCADDPIGLRNRALLLLAYDSLRRRSELISLRVEDIERNRDGRITILLRKSKTDQEGSGAWVHLGWEASEALNAWLDYAKLNYGFIFRGISPKGCITETLSDGQVGRIFKSLAQSAGFSADTVRAISGHSMRVGAAQDLLVAGASLPQIMVKGGWAKTDTVMRYIERVRLPW
jgi:site-specific recombinase XerD